MWKYVCKCFGTYCHLHVFCVLYEVSECISWYLSDRYRCGTVQLWRQILNEMNTVRTFLLGPFIPRRKFFDPSDLINGLFRQNRGYLQQLFVMKYHLTRGIAFLTQCCLFFKMLPEVNYRSCQHILQTHSHQCLSFQMEFYI